MPSRFRHVALVGKFQARGSRDMLEQVARFLSERSVRVTLEHDTSQATGLDGYASADVDTLGRDCDLAVVVGGDGTMLGIARRLARHGTPLVGINQGRLGFITDVRLGEFEAALGPMLEGDYEEEHRTMLEGDVLRGDERIFEGYAMNDVVVNRGAVASLVELKVAFGDEFVANFRADGLIVSSPTGSTAYALSAGGPLLHPAIAGWVLVPIAPHELSNRPIVLPDGDTITIEIVACRDASVSFDMQSLASLEVGDRIRVRRSAHQVRFLHPRGWSYFATLRRKLHWNAGGSPPGT